MGCRMELYLSGFVLCQGSFFVRVLSPLCRTEAFLCQLEKYSVLIAITRGGAPKPPPQGAGPQVSVTNHFWIHTLRSYT